MRADIARGIVETAAALGMDPIDLATIISYETGGTFDPAQPGPTTQWGQHRGLIQFGEPQARQYGVDWKDPLRSQLGPDGAVARYFRDRGYRPGMGLLDAYSIVNAGAPGLYNRSDANNGGAPGTVRDKVQNQMRGHRRNAEALLGGIDAGDPRRGTFATGATRADTRSEFTGDRPRNVLALPGFEDPRMQGLAQFNALKGLMPALSGEDQQRKQYQLPMSNAFGSFI